MLTRSQLRALAEVAGGYVRGDRVRVLFDLQRRGLVRQLALGAWHLTDAGERVVADALAAIRARRMAA